MKPSLFSAWITQPTLLLAGFLTLQGCALQDASSPPNSSAISENMASARIIQFIKQVIAHQSYEPVSIELGNFTYKGAYTGTYHGCARADVTNQRDQALVYYQDCQGSVTVINHAPPLYPNDHQAALVKQKTIHHAYHIGVAHASYAHYWIRSQVIGPLLIDHCSNILTTITYHGLLVNQSSKVLCD